MVLLPGRACVVIFLHFTFRRLCDFAQALSLPPVDPGFIPLCAIEQRWPVLQAMLESGQGPETLVPGGFSVCIVAIDDSYPVACF